MMKKPSVGDEIKSQISETMKKIILTGVGTIFLTEETIRSYLGEYKLPKELWTGLLENAEKTKKEFFTAFSKEIGQILSKVDFTNEMKKILEDHRIKINVELSFDKLKKDKSHHE